MRHDCDQILNWLDHLNPWISADEFAERAHISRKTVGNYCSNGRIQQTRRLGRFYLIHEDELKKFKDHD